MSDLSREIELLRRQYLQLLDLEKLSIPESNILKRPEVQAQIFESVFREDRLVFPPPDRYTLRVLKMLVAALEAAIDDPEKDVWGTPIVFVAEYSICNQIL